MTKMLEEAAKLPNTSDKGKSVFGKPNEEGMNSQ